ncbi:MAG: hypothetical protein ACRDYU_02985 [Actinomycetes bacterium]
MAKKALTWLAIAFALFYVLSAPNDAAGAVREVASGLREAFDSVAVFVESLFT